MGRGPPWPPYVSLLLISSFSKNKNYKHLGIIVAENKVIVTNWYSKELGLHRLPGKAFQKFGFHLVDYPTIELTVITST